MKITVPLGELSKKMNAISSVVPAKTTMPILSTVLISADKSGISFSATDLDISVTSKVNGKVEKEGSVASPAKKIAEIVKSLSGEEVAMEVDSDKLTIECGKGRFVVNSRSPEDFPRLPQQECKTEFTIESGLLGKLIQKTIYAVSTDLTRPALCGVLWEVDKSGVVMVSTDGHRLAKVEAELKMGDVQKMDVIVPPKAPSTLRSYTDKDEFIKVKLGENSISFTLEEVLIYSRLLEGPFPNYRKVIPVGNKKELVVSKEALSSATKRVSILSDNLTHQVIFSMDDNKLTLHVSTMELGEAREEVDVSYSDDKMDIGYNASYIQDILRTIESEDIEIKLDRPDTAGIVTPFDKTEAVKQLCIVMPLRIS